MMRAGAVAASCLLLLGQLPVAAQNRIVAEIPIELSRNKTIIPVTVGGASLRLILDSGLGYDGALVFDTAKVDLHRFGHLVQAQVGGAGSGAPAGALFDSAATFSIGPISFQQQRVILLTSDVYRGFPTDGVIGYSLLGHYAVELDYDHDRMRLYEPATFIPGPEWSSVDISFKENNVPWLMLRATIDGGAPVTLAAYVDFASGEALELLKRQPGRFPLPAASREKLVGRGLSGDIHGYEARLPKVMVGPFTLADVAIVVVPAEVRSKQRTPADAIVANNLLRRFNVIFDYAHARLHLKPNRYFAEPF